MIPSAQPVATPKPDKLPDTPATTTTTTTTTTASTTEKRPVRNMAEIAREQAMKSVVKFNKQLNLERKEERSCSMDLQTLACHYPVGLGIHQKQYQKYWKRHGKLMPSRAVSNFPIAIINEQYQDVVDHYSADKLTELPVKRAKIFKDMEREKQLPRNLPEMPIEEYYDLSESDDDIENCDCHIDEANKKPEPEHVNNDDVFLAALKQKIKSGSTNSISGSQSSTGTATPSKPGIIASLSASLTNNVPLSNPPSHGPIHPGQCKVCQSDMTMESLLKCSDCSVASHHTCLGIVGELLDAVRLYDWQCTDCKVCTQCRQPHDEDKMMFCDKCDRGYHTYCIGVSSIPEGHWACSLCARCASCNTTTLPTVNGILTEWQHELISFVSPDGQQFNRHHVYCFTCHKAKKQ